MAIYHLTATVISRGRGQSMVAAAAYRTGTVLRDQRYGVVHHYVGRRGVTHCEILAPDSAPAWARDRERLWNEVEARESRKDAQLARLVEVGLPVELSGDERLALVRDYVQSQFVALGMVADFAIRGELANPHAHILLTLRSVGQAGFGPKERGWNGKDNLRRWRATWAATANRHLANAGHSVRIDHRTLEAQLIELLPGRWIGVARSRQAEASLPDHLSDRIAEQCEIARQNGAMILEDPTVALRAITHQRPVFTADDVSRFLKSRTADAAQFTAALAAVMQCADCVPLDPETAERRRFTSRDMIEAERSLLRRAVAMAARTGHGIPAEFRSGLPEDAVSGPLGRTFAYLVGEGDAKAVAVTAPDRDLLEEAARRVWAQRGFAVIESTDAPLNRDCVLLLDACHTLGVKELERSLAAADSARAKAVLFANADQLEAMRTAPPFSKLASLIGPA